MILKTMVNYTHTHSQLADHSLLSGASKKVPDRYGQRRRSPGVAGWRGVTAQDGLMAHFGRTRKREKWATRKEELIILPRVLEFIYLLRV